MAYVKFQNGLTAIHVAAEYGQAEVVQDMLQKVAGGIPSEVTLLPIKYLLIFCFWQVTINSFIVWIIVKRVLWNYYAIFSVHVEKKMLKE